MSRAKRKRVNAMRRKQRRQVERLASALLFSPFGQALLSSLTFRITRHLAEQGALP